MFAAMLQDKAPLVRIIDRAVRHSEHGRLRGELIVDLLRARHTDAEAERQFNIAMTWVDTENCSTTTPMTTSSPSTPPTRQTPPERPRKPAKRTELTRLSQPPQWKQRSTRQRNGPPRIAKEES